MPKPPHTQHNNPLHGITLAQIVAALVDHYGWQELAARIPINCFSHDPSIKSSLTFLRRTPWARDKVEALYLQMLSQSDA
ncbi:MAG: VF530 family protein [Methylophilus sp.]